jgi:hypothetical protein
MIKPTLLLAAAVAALAASPAAARPMTAIDLQSMHRLGSPDVSPDGRWAAFTVSATDWEKNKRVNILHLLDLTKPGARPQPVAGAEKGHDAVFGADGSLWFLMPVKDQEQLFRMAIGGKPVQVSEFKGDIGGFKISPSGTEVVVWADRDLRCANLNCLELPKDAKIGSGRTFDQLFTAAPFISRFARRVGSNPCRPTSISSPRPQMAALHPSTSPTPTTRPIRFPPSRRTAARSPMSRWPGLGMSRIEPSSCCATSPRGEFVR